MISVVLFLILNLSISKNTNGSAKDMLEDKAAKNNNIKNAKLNNEPKGILANITGSEINIKPGPEDGDKSWAKIRGNMARPDNKATNKSRRVIIKTDLNMEIFLGK